MTEPRQFNETSWRTVCRLCAQSAMRDEQPSATLAHMELHNAIHVRLTFVDEEHHARAIQIAKEFGYRTKDQLMAQAARNLREGNCLHGLRRVLCTKGCAQRTQQDGTHAGIDIEINKAFGRTHP